MEKQNQTPQLPQNAVSNSTILTTKVPVLFAENVDKYHKDYNVKILDISIHERSIMNVVVSGKMSDLILLNKKCEEETYGDIDID
jgi:hypothetical protein